MNLQKRLLATFALVALLAVSGLAFAQDETTIADVTGNSLDYYGTEVTLEGVVGELANVKMFALGEGVAVGNALVLVVNNSQEDFSIELMPEVRVTVTGVVFPSITAVEDGAQTNFGEAVNELIDTSDDVFSVEEVPEGDNAEDYDNVPQLVDYVYNGNLLDGFNNYTIIVIDSADDITYIEDVSEE